MQAKGRQRPRRSIYSDNSYPNIRRKFSVSEFFCPVNSKKSDAQERFPVSAFCVGGLEL